MTNRPDAPTGFCHHCGAMRVIVGPGFCSACGRPVAATPAPNWWQPQPTQPWWAARPPVYGVAQPPFTGYANPSDEERRYRRLAPLVIALCLVAIVAVTGGLFVAASTMLHPTPGSTPTQPLVGAGQPTPPPTTETPTPGATAKATPTSRPKATPKPTPTPKPTAKPKPTATPPPQWVALPKLTYSVSGATVKYFGVTGATSSQLYASIGNNSGTDCGTINYTWYTGDTEPGACTAWRFSYYYSWDSSACWMTSITLKQTVYLPRWSSKVKVWAPLLAWWRKLMTLMKTHESGHVAISARWLKTMRSRLIGVEQPTCSQVSSNFNVLISDVNAAQEAYDKVQYSTEVFPVPPD